MYKKGAGCIAESNVCIIVDALGSVHKLRGGGASKKRGGGQQFWTPLEEGSTIFGPVFRRGQQFVFQQIQSSIPFFSLLTDFFLKTWHTCWYTRNHPFGFNISAWISCKKERGILFVTVFRGARPILDTQKSEIWNISPLPKYLTFSPLCDNSSFISSKWSRLLYNQISTHCVIVSIVL